MLRYTEQAQARADEEGMGTKAGYAHADGVSMGVQLEQVRAHKQTKHAHKTQACAYAGRPATTPAHRRTWRQTVKCPPLHALGYSFRTESALPWFLPQAAAMSPDPLPSPRQAQERLDFCSPLDFNT